MFAIGNVVHLISGGPLMTVEGLGKSVGKPSDTDTHCVYFVESELYRYSFRHEVLKLYSKGTKQNEESLVS